MAKSKALRKPVSPFAENVTQALIKSRKYGDPTVSALTRALDHDINPHKVFEIRQNMRLPPLCKGRGASKRIGKVSLMMVSNLVWHGERSPTRIVRIMKSLKRPISVSTASAIIWQNGFEPIRKQAEESSPAKKKLIVSLRKLDKMQLAERWSQLQKLRSSLIQNYRALLEREGRANNLRRGITKKERKILDRISAVQELLEALEPLVPTEIKEQTDAERQ